MSRNPEYQFVATNVDELISSMIALYESITKTTVRQASPERLFIQWAANVILHQQMLINYTGNQNIPSRAVGENLDALGELFYAHERPEAKSAVCTERFYISAAQERPVLIPKGTRVTDTAEELVWETEDDAYIPAGDVYIDVPIRCQAAGVIGNGYAAGQINTFVDLYDYCSSCSNVTVSGGGADRADDEEFYELLRASQEAYSTAGSEGSYVYHAKSVSTEITDVKAVRPTEMHRYDAPIYEREGVKYLFFGGETLLPETLVLESDGGAVGELGRDYSYEYSDGLLVIALLAGGIFADAQAVGARIEKVGAGEVEIYVLMDDGSIAGEEIKNAVLEACSAETVRPLTDHVEMKDPEVHGYSIDVTYYIPRGSLGNSAAIQAKVAAAVDDFVSWQAAKLGRDINPSKLTDMMMSTGIKRVEIREPVYTVLSDGSLGKVPELASVSEINIINGGVEEE